MVRCMINLAYMTVEEAKNFQFTPKGLKDKSAARVERNTYQGPNEML